MSTHTTYMQRCIQLAKNGLGTTYPNPLVGSVIVYNNRIIGEGWHYEAGKAHAEVNAINSVKDATLLKDATIYVSLEPCSHHGKTPPCSDLIITKGIKKIVIGTVDPFAKVSGNGIRKLKKAGCEVIVGVLEDQCKALNKRFFTFHMKKRPYIILKWAQTSNGFIAPDNSDNRAPVWITGKHSRQLVHKWRGEEQSILVGTNTVIKDNPKLTIRNWEGTNPTRIVLDLHDRIPLDSCVLDQTVKTIILTQNPSKKTTTDFLIYEIINDETPILDQLCYILYKNNLQSVIIEGGRKTIQSFIDQNLWDEARVFIGNKHFESGTKAPILTSKGTRCKKLDDDTLIHYKND